MHYEILGKIEMVLGFQGRPQSSQHIARMMMERGSDINSFLGKQRKKLRFWWPLGTSFWLHMFGRLIGVLFCFVVFVTNVFDDML